MIHRANPALPCADAGPVGAATSLKSELHQAFGREMGDQLAKSGRENRHIRTACRHATGRPAHRLPQP